MTGVDPGRERMLAERCQGIELLLLDVDGVLTDGTISIDGDGSETKHFFVRDGSALALWRGLGRRAAILSGRSATAVEHRARELGIGPVIQGVKDKGAPFRAMLDELGLGAHQVCFVGDDLPDLPVLLAVGLGACPADAAAEVRAAVPLVTAAAGGRGAVREVVETILKHQGLWDDLVSRRMTPA